MERKVQFYRFNSEDGKLTREQGPPSPGTPIPEPKAVTEATDLFFKNASLDLLRKKMAFSLRMEQFPRAPITPPTLRQRLSAHLWDLRRRIANRIYPIDNENY